MSENYAEEQDVTKPKSPPSTKPIRYTPHHEPLPPSGPMVNKVIPLDGKQPPDGKMLPQGEVKTKLPIGSL